MEVYIANEKYWDDIKRWADKTDSASDHCFLELRSRIEALETAMNIHRQKNND